MQEIKCIVLTFAQTLTEKLSSWEWWTKAFFKFYSSIGMIPYSWDADQQILKITTCKMQKYLWYITVIWLTCDNTYLIIQASKINYSSTDDDEILKFLVHMISRLAAGCGAVTVWLKMDLSSDLLNRSLKMHRHYKGWYFGNSQISLKEGLVGLIGIGTVITCVHPIIGPLLQHLGERQSMRYWGSQYLPPKLYNSVPGIIFFAIVELLLSYMCLSGACYPMLILFLYSGITKFWLHKLSVRDDRKFNLRIKIRTFRTLQVLDTIHKECCSDFWWPMTQNVYMYIHVLINVILIKYHSSLPTSYFLMLASASILLTWFEKNCIRSASELYEFSLEVRNEVMNCKRSMRFVGRSFRCLRANVSFFYYLKQRTFSTYIRTLVDYTITVLLGVES